MLLDPNTWDLAQRADELLGVLGDDLAGKLLGRDEPGGVELATSPHATVGEAMAELGRLRARLARDARAIGLATAAAGMHPGAMVDDPQVSPTARYQLVHRHDARDRAARADLRAARAHRRGGPRERDPAAQPPARPSPAAPGAVGQLAAVARPGDGVGLQPDDPLPGLPAHRPAAALRELRGLGAHRRRAHALRRDPGADLPVVGRAAAAAVRHRRGAHHGRAAAAGDDGRPVRARAGAGQAGARGGLRRARARGRAGSARGEPLPRRPRRCRGRAHRSRTRAFARRSPTW